MIAQKACPGPSLLQLCRRYSVQVGRGNTWPHRTTQLRQHLGHYMTCLAHLLSFVPRFDNDCHDVPLLTMASTTSLLSLSPFPRVPAQYSDCHLPRLTYAGSHNNRACEWSHYNRYR